MSVRGGRGDFRALLELDALAMVIMDVAWGGGVSEARKLSAMAEAWPTVRRTTL